MLIKISKEESNYNNLIKEYTVKNKDFERQCRVRKNNNLERLRWIKLYRMDVNYNLYLPIGKFSHLINEVGDKIDFKFNGTLNEEQNKILETIKENNLRTGLINMKTARGKTYMLMGIVDYFKEKTLILCHNIKTVTEMKDKIFKESGYECGLYYSKKKKIKDITITTHQSFVQDTEGKLSGFDIVIYDECHLDISKDMITKLITYDSIGLFGMTGTPERQELNKQDMELIFGDELVIEGQENNGYNIIPEINILEFYNTTIFSFQTWHELRDQMLSDKKRFEKQIDFLLLEAEFKHGILLVDRVEEAERYYEELGKYFEVGLIVGGTKIEEDEKIIKSFEKSEKKNIIIGTVQKMGTGVDINYIDTLFFFFPCRSFATTIQAAGRILRNYEGKVARIYDWWDMPLLKEQGKQRLMSYKSEYKEITLNYLKP